MQLNRDGHFATGDITLDGDIRGMEIVTLPGGGTYLYTATGVGGGMTAWRIDGPGLATLADRQYFPNWISAAVDGLAAWMDDGAAGQIVIGGEAGSDLLCYGLGMNGEITTLGSVGPLAPDTDRIWDVAGVDLGTLDVMYLADAGTGRITGYQATASGGYAVLGGAARIATSGAVELETCRMGGQGFLLVADTGTQQVTSYRIDAATGGLSLTGQIGAAEGLGIATPTAMEVVRAFGQHFVILGAADSSSLSVMRLSASGGLEATDHRIDGLATRFSGLTAMAVAQDGDRVFVVAGGADDGLSLFTLLPGGRLALLQTLEHTQGAGLMNVAGIVATVVGDTLRIYVTSGTDGGISQYSADLGTLGEVLRGTGQLTGTAGDDLIEATDGNAVLSGRAGDDILIATHAGAQLWGGIGADTFVLGAAAGTYRILDFRAGEDRLDLSDFPMLRNVSQLDFAATATGARLGYRGTEIEITSAGGATLSLQDIFGAGFDWADRVMPLPAAPAPGPGAGQPPIAGQPPTAGPPPVAGPPITGTPGNDRLQGSPQNDEITGGDGADTLIGDGGSDRIWGGNGSDVLRGDAGNDTMGGGNGNDILIGGGGDDNLGGGAGHDEIWGGLGNDILQGGPGNDTMGGGAGNDILSGGAGADRLGGAAGDDQIWGGDHDDLLQGGDGDDTIGGGDGNDTMTSGDGDDMLGGGAGHDEIWGGAGNDTASGGGGNDVIGGGDGDDVLGGGEGNDVLGGGDGDDTLSGGGGRDEIWGGRGNDSLAGGPGNDVIAGGAGDDRISGGAGHDLLVGGAGADTFIFGPGSGNDRITDFQPGTDHIRIALPGAGYGALDIDQTPGGVLVHLPGGGSIELANVALSALGADDFIFG